MEFYSQYGQDKFLFENFFKEKSNGFYLDIGAHDGITLSNTYLFEKLGWDGVCIEPIPDVFTKLKSNRNCKLFNCVLSNKKGTENFLVLEGYTEMLSGILENYDPAHLIRIDNELRIMGGSKKVIVSESLTFDDLELPNIIDFVSLDVEGSEMKILETIDFNKYHINIISIEVNHGADEITNFIESKNFEKIGSLGCDFIFKNKIYKN
jgi:FkbM family methyltransferase